MKKKYFVLILTLMGCFKSAEKLTLQKQEFIPSDVNKNLKINGYYMETNSFNIPRIFFLFQNGVFLDWGGVSNSLGLIGTNEKDIRDSTISYFIKLENYKKKQYGWGIFQAKSEHIIIEKWLSGNGGPYPTEIFTGKIINDTTISIYISDHNLKGFEKPNIYKFQIFNPKPDSVNVFIK